MKRILLSAALSVAALAFPCRLRAQFIGFTSPQTVSQTLAATACVGGAALNVANLGQSFHFISYQTGGNPSEVAVSIQGSYDGLNWLIISDLARDTVSGQLEGFGYFPAVRVVGSCFGGTAPTVAIQYSGTSVSSSITAGALDATTYRKPLFRQVAANANYTTATVSTPFGSLYGALGCQYLTAAPAGSTVNVLFSADNILSSFTIAGPYTLDNTIINNAQLFLLPAAPASTIQVNYTSGGASTGNISCEILFFKPGVVPNLQASQPPGQSNTEQTSAANTAVSKTITGQRGLRAHIFTVSARCSAGTAQLTITDGGTQLWSTAATEVGTTTFRFQWSPGLAAGFNNTMVVTLGACGVANTGTLDVQASQF